MWKAPFLKLKDKAEVARISLCCYCVDFSSRQSSTQRRSELSAVRVHVKALKSLFHDQKKKKNQNTAASFAGWISESLPEWRQREASSVYRSYTKIRPKEVIAQRRENFPPVCHFLAVIKPSGHQRGDIKKCCENRESVCLQGQSTDRMVVTKNQTLQHSSLRSPRVALVERFSNKKLMPFDSWVRPLGCVGIKDRRGSPSHPETCRHSLNKIS